jgi:amino acid transporter
MAERAADRAPGTGAAPGLRGSLGTAGIVFLVVAAASPLVAIGGALPVMMAAGNGAGAPVSYLVVTGVLLLFSVGYAAMSRHVEGAGAFYAYVTAGLGRTAGAGAVGLALLSYTAIQAAVYGLAGAVLGGTVAAYGGPGLPWWSWSLLLLVVVGVLGFRSVDVGARVLSVLIVCEVGILAVMVGAVLLRGGADGLSAEPFTPGAFLSGSPGIGLMFAVACFIGFEATAIYGEEARDARRTVPRATYAAVLLIGGFYTLVAWAVVVAVGADRARTAAAGDIEGLVFTVAHAFAGPGVVTAMEILLLTSLFTGLLAFHNTIARYLYAIGHSVPSLSVLAATHHRHGSPHTASLAQSAGAAALIAVCALARLDPVRQVFTWASGMATVGVLALMVMVSAAVVVFFARTRADRRWWHTRIAPVLGTAGLCGVLLLVLANLTTLIDGSAGLAALFVVLLAAAFAAGAVPAALRRG